MASWLIDTPRRLTLDGLETDQAPGSPGEVNRLDVWLASGRLRVVTGPGREQSDHG